MALFKNERDPFKQPYEKTFLERAKDLFKPQLVSPVPDSPYERDLGERVKDLFVKPEKPEPAQAPILGPGEFETREEKKAYKERKSIPPWYLEGVEKSIKDLPKEVLGATKRWEETIAMTKLPKTEIANAMNVMFAESSGDPGAINENKNGSKDYGLMQINDIHAPAIKKTFGYDMKELLDPKKNLEVAAWIWEKQGWYPWVGAKKIGLIL